MPFPKGSEINIPALPKGYYAGGLGTKAGSFWVALYVPEGKHQYFLSQTNILNLSQMDQYIVGQGLMMILKEELMQVLVLLIYYTS